MTQAWLKRALRRVRLLLSGRSPTAAKPDIDIFAALDAVEDFNLGIPREVSRYVQTNIAILQAVGAVDTILEVGSCEGDHTIHLAQIAAHVIGIEYSARAATQAQAKVPNATIIIGKAEDLLELVGDRRFDLALACEILYLLKDPASVIADLKRLVPRIIVTNYARRAQRVEPLLTGPGWQRLDDIAAEGLAWRCYLWIDPALSAEVGGGGSR